MQNFVYLPVATLSTQGNKKVLKQWKWRLKCIISWNEYQSKILVPQNQYLDHLVDLNFQGIWKWCTPNKSWKILSFVEIKDYDIMIDRSNSYDQPVKIM